MGTEGPAQRTTRGPLWRVPGGCSVVAPQTRPPRRQHPCVACEPGVYGLTDGAQLDERQQACERGRRDGGLRNGYGTTGDLHRDGVGPIRPNRGYSVVGGAVARRYWGRGPGRI